MSRFAWMALLVGIMLVTSGCATSSNNNAQRDPYGPDLDELTGKEMPPGYGLVR